MDDHQAMKSLEARCMASKSSNESNSLPYLSIKHIKDQFWNFIFLKFIFIFGVLNLDSANEVGMWCAWFSIIGFLSIHSQICKDRFEYVRKSQLSQDYAVLSVFFRCSSYLFRPQRPCGTISKLLHFSTVSYACAWYSLAYRLSPGFKLVWISGYFFWLKYVKEI